jgi:hypothetical protein
VRGLSVTHSCSSSSSSRRGGDTGRMQAQVSAMRHKRDQGNRLG